MDDFSGERNYDYRGPDVSYGDSRRQGDYSGYTQAGYQPPAYGEPVAGGQYYNATPIEPQETEVDLQGRVKFGWLLCGFISGLLGLLVAALCTYGEKTFGKSMMWTGIGIGINVVLGIAMLFFFSTVLVGLSAGGVAVN